MDMKLNHSELNAIFAKATGMQISDAEAFTKAFFDTLVEGLEAEGSVKINGLGTFKVIDVDSRSSVDVNTGERIEIKGHKKLTFVPADSLKEVINEPFAMFQPVEVDESLVDDEEPASTQEEVAEEVAAEENNDNIATEPMNVTEEVPFVPSEVEEEMPADSGDTLPTGVNAAVGIDEEMPVEVVEEVVAPQRNVASEKQTVQEVAPEDVIEEVTADNAEAVEAGPAPVPVVDNKEEKPSEAVQPAGEKECAKKNRSKAKMPVLVMALLALCLAGFYIYNKGIDASNEQVAQPAVADVVETLPVADDANVNDTVVAAPVVADSVAQPMDTVPFVLVEALAARSLTTISVADTVDYLFAGTICEHKVTLEETLTKISLQHYGDKKLWPYIVKYNKMSRPNDLACGMLLEIPRLVPRK